MKNKSYNLINVLILAVFLGCQNKHNLEGNYSICSFGEYTEVYFKKDSIRAASNINKDYLSEWRKIEIKNDTLYFEKFGEWRDSAKAKINYVGMSKIELILSSGINLNLKPINENPKFDKPKEFWNRFYNRQNSANCSIK